MFGLTLRFQNFPFFLQYLTFTVARISQANKDKSDKTRMCPACALQNQSGEKSVKQFANAHAVEGTWAVPRFLSQVGFQPNRRVPYEMGAITSNLAENLTPGRSGRAEEI